MKCSYCNADNPEQVQICVNCGKKLDMKHGKTWHSLHNLLWGSKIDQDILDTLNELNSPNEPFIDSARKLKKT